jgi:hypothetical protein
LFRPASSNKIENRKIEKWSAESHDENEEVAIKI